MDRRTLGHALLCIAALTAGACGSSANENPGTPRTVVPDAEISVVGEPVPIADRLAPDIRALTAHGESFDLEALRGHVVVVNFWATWCAPCVVEMPILVDTYAALRDSGLVVLGVSLDREGFDVVRPFLERFQVDYPVIIDDDFTTAFGGAYVLPTTFFVDKRGYVVSRINGRLHEDVLTREIRRLL